MSSHGFVNSILEGMVKVSSMNKPCDLEESIILESLPPPAAAPKQLWIEKLELDTAASRLAPSNAHAMRCRSRWGNPSQRPASAFMLLRRSFHIAVFLFSRASGFQMWQSCRNHSELGLPLWQQISYFESPAKPHLYDQARPCKTDRIDRHELEKISNSVTTCVSMYIIVYIYINM